MAARFLQIHTLTTYPAALLNRDDAGYAKRLPFGSATRTRISSQCLKRHWRMAEDEHALANIGPDMSVRSRETFSRLIVEPLVGEGLAREAVEAACSTFKAALFQESDKAKAKKEKAEDKAASFATGQVVILGLPEIGYLRDEIRAVVLAGPTAKAAEAGAAERVKVLKENLAALKIGAGLDAAMFGRMVTSDILARKTAAVHVAHAFTVHAEESESDYFTAVDDLTTGTEETGSAMIGQAELTSGLYYGYVVVDMPTLVANLEGLPAGRWLEADHALARQVVEHLVHLIAKVSPGAKLGSTAPYSWAQMVLLETGSRQPRTLANAFHTAVRTGNAGMLDSALAAVGKHLGALDAMYGAKEQRWQAGGDAPLPGAARLPFDEAVAAAVAALGR